MFNTRKYVSKIANNSETLYSLSEKENIQLKQCLLKMYNDILEVCIKYKLTVLLGGGSALGAIRHGGFIPWDDDLDLNMPREDYNLFIQVFDKELSDKYEITTPNSKYQTTHIFTKVYKKNTRLIDMFNSATDTPKGIFIDIFPIENAPKSKVVRALKGFLSNTVYYIAASTSLYQQRNQTVEEYFSVSRVGKVNYNIRKIIGFLASFKSYKEWYNFYDRTFTNSKPSNVYCIPSGRNHYFGEIYSKDVLFPPRKVKFEGTIAYVPNNVDYYLKNLYGDYMKIPPEDKREKHMIIKFEI
ncbi:LicD family protein [Heyndrickxia coagulans]|uniref:LicD family protein n=1 Tax=Heyndrickxia coagulans TaxID=1398 RepID=UPI0023E35311|nr:LicD family protein [Heyndrickxia coagulans]